ncbi:MAG: hypothetical protein WA705_24670 [Candidatus Ozemobacteraceae bacterium]
MKEQPGVIAVRASFEDTRRGFLLPLVIFLIVGFAAAYPMLNQHFATTQKRAQNIEEWFRIQWAIEGANQKQIESAVAVSDPFCGFVRTVATFTYPMGTATFSVAVALREGRTFLGRNRFISATATASWNGINAGYYLEDFASPTISVPGVSAGGTFSFGWKKNGQLLSWGSYSAGQLAYSGSANVPVEANFRQAWAVAGGTNHTLAIDYNGLVWSWGSTANGKLGGGGSGAVPGIVVFPNGIPLMDIAAGGEFSLALSSDGHVYSWGDNAVGQLGLNNTTDKSSPQLISTLGIYKVTGIAAGSQHALAITDSGNIFGWGNNSYNQLGAAFNSTRSLKPIKVNDTVATWVAQIAYATGNKTPSNTQFYIPVGHFIGSFTVEMDATNKTGGWNYDFIRLTHSSGSKKDLSLSSPTQISTTRFIWKHEPESSIPLDQPGTYTVSVWNRSQFLWWWNESNLNSHWYRDNTTAKRGVYSFFGRPIEEPTNFIGIAAGGEFSLAVASEANLTKVYSWGRNNYGQLGQGAGQPDHIDRMTPIENFPPSGEKIRGICAGSEHALALTASGKVYSWGHNDFGQLGVGATTTTFLTSPYQVKGALQNKTITGIAAGDDHSLAIDSDGYVYSWGLRTDGRVGDGSSSGNQTAPYKLTSGFP